MTDITAQDRELIARLRSVDQMCVEDCFLQSPLFVKAADRIEQLARAYVHLEATVSGLNGDIWEIGGNFERAAARIAELEAALGYYAVPQNYIATRECPTVSTGVHRASLIEQDRGSRARAALEGGHDAVYD